MLPLKYICIYGNGSLFFLVGKRYTVIMDVCCFSKYAHLCLTGQVPHSVVLYISSHKNQL